MKLFKYQSNKNYIVALMQNRIPLFGEFIATDIRRRSVLITPTKFGNLHLQISITNYGTSTIISWIMPYAAYQERGMRADGTHIIKNYTTPGTGPHFAQITVHEVIPQYGTFWRRVQQAIPAKNN